MKVTRKSMITGVNNTMEIDVSLDQIRQWETGTLIQNAMPHLNPDEREFIKTGITPEEWESNLTSE